MIILLLLLMLSENTFLYVSADDTIIFARIMYDDVYLYRSPISVDDCTNIYFELPQTYFVELLDSPNEEFYQAKYMNYTGYVKKDSVQAILGTPLNPYLNNVTFRVYAELSRDLRSLPTIDTMSTQLTYIPLLTKNITYIGEVKGECLIEGRTNVWYYCKYTSDKEYTGYVYSDFCDEMTSYTTNTENVTYTTNPDFSNNDEPQNTMSFNDNLIGIVIGILSIPALIFAFMIIKSKQILNKDSNKREVIDY